MTTAEAVAWLESLPKTTISPSQLAIVVGGDPYSYNLAAKEGKLNYLSHFWSGRNLRISKGAVIKLVKGESNDENIQSR